MNQDSLSIESLSAEAEEARGEDVMRVDVGTYEGPLHLLLELARRQKVDLMQVSMLALAEQYLAFIKAAQAKRIDLAADYLLMASWLTYLKSRLLLPKPEKGEDEELSGEDMAAQLAFRLKRLDAMRQAGDALMAGPILGTRVFPRGDPRQPKVVKLVDYDTTLWHLTQAFGTIRGRKEKEAPHRIERQTVLPLEEAREHLRSVSPSLANWASLEDIRRQLGQLHGEALPARSVTASVFSAALELTREGDVDIRQDAHFAPVFLRRAGPIDMESEHETA